MSATELEIRVTAEMREIRAALAQLTGQIDQVNQRAARSAQGGRQLASSLQASAVQGRAAATATEQVRQNIAGAVAQVRLLVGGLGLAAVATTLVRMADSATLLRGQLTLATKSQEEFNRAQAETFAIAQRTRQGLEATVNLYARIARAGRTTQSQTLALTESINQAVALSFTTAQAGEAALFQLGQGLASGTLRGEELNSVLEQTPRLAQAIAEGLVEMGKIDTTAQLRQFAQDGKLTADLVTQAISSQQRVLREEFAKLPPTVGQAFTALRNAALQWIGDLDSANGATRQLADAILFLADNLRTMAELLVLGAKLWAGYYLAFRVLPGAIALGTTAFASLRASMALATPAMRAFQAQAIALTATMNGAAAATARFSLAMNGTALLAAGAATKIRAAGALALSGWVGWELGSYLRREFLQVELFGIALAAGLTKAANVIKNSFIITWGTIKAAGLSMFNSLLERGASFAERLAAIQETIPGVRRLAETTRAAAAAMRGARVETETAEQAYNRLAATATAELAEIDLTYMQIADAAMAARDAAVEGAEDTEDAATGVSDAVKAAADSFKLLRDEAERALRDLEQLYEDFGISTRAYFEERVRLQQAAIDADIAGARAQLASATTDNERRNALTQIIILERERRDIATQGARDQAKAEEELARQLGDVYIRLMELDGRTADARRAELESQYRDLLARMKADADQAGYDLVRRLINVEAAKAGLQQFQTEFRDVTGALSQLQETTSAQVQAGLLSNSTAEKRMEEARTKALEQLTQQREAVAALYQEYKDPETLQHLQALDQQIAQLSISTEDWRGKIQDAATGSLTTFFRELVDGSTSASEAIRNLAVNFTQALAQMAAQALAKKAIQSIMDMFSQGDGEGGGAQVANAAAAGLAYAAPVTTAATVLAGAGATVTAGATALAASAAALQAAATTLLIANSMSAGVAHQGGIAGALGTMRNVNPAMFWGAPRYHTGGVAGLGPNEVPAILQRGEEVLTRNDPRHRYNGGMGGAGEPLEDRVRFVFVDDQRDVGNYLESAQGERAVVRIMQRNKLK